MKTMALMCLALLVIACVGTGNQFQSSSGWLTSPKETLAYGDPSGRVDPGQVAFRHGARLDETAGVLSAATIADPKAREKATNAITEISKDRNRWGYNWGGGAGGYSFGYGGARENILQRGAVVNRSDYPVRVDFAPTMTYGAVGPEPSGKPQSIMVMARNYEIVTLPPGEYRFTAYNQKGKVIADERDKEIDWVRGNSEFRVPDTSDIIAMDWLFFVD
ncbi:MAG: hypothetical protein WC610_01560 [Patescibacteria group bacterium]